MTIEELHNALTSLTNQVPIIAIPLNIGKRQLE
jgi:hypothetical protein